MARRNTEHAEGPRSSRHGRGAARSRRRGTSVALAWIGVVVVALTIVAGGVFGVRAVLAARSNAAMQRNAQPAAPTDAVETTTAPESTATSSAETPEPAVAQDPAPTSGSDQAVPVLMYHHIMPNPNNSIAISPETFDGQMEYLKDNGYHPVSIKQFNAFVERGEALPDKPVLITFDDNRSNQLKYGVPILKKYGFTATFFVVKKWIDVDSDSFMRKAELKQLIADGFDVESHTTNHIQIHPSKLKSTGKTESYKSFKSRYLEPTQGMRTWMDDTFGGPVTALAYPGGRYNPEAERLMKDAGYTTAFTTNDGYVTYKGQSPYALPRWNTGAKGTSLSRFAAIMKGAKKHKPKGQDD